MAIAAAAVTAAELLVGVELAATAAARDTLVVSSDSAAFADLPGVPVRA